MDDSPVPGRLTLLLQRTAAGDRSAESELAPFIYAALHDIAVRNLRNERPNHTLQPTALLHEAWVRLLQMRELDWKCRGQFFALAARVMRQVLIDYGRARGAAKRRGGVRVDLESVPQLDPADPEFLLSLDAAMKRLRSMNDRAGSVAEMKFFGGFSIEEISKSLGISNRTAKRDWQIAKLWLQKELYGTGDRQVGKSVGSNL
jgi:RNA polymerase sigma-70 factor, ECF subfamily